MTTRTPEQSARIDEIRRDLMARPSEARTVLAARTIVLLGTEPSTAGRLLADMEPELRGLCEEYVDLAEEMVREPAMMKLLESVAANAPPEPAPGGGRPD